jgi:hypothetical protein
VAVLVLLLVRVTGSEMGLALGRARVMARHSRQLAPMNRPRRRTP